MIIIANLIFFILVFFTIIYLFFFCVIIIPRLNFDICIYLSKMTVPWSVVCSPSEPSPTKLRKFMLKVTTPLARNFTYTNCSISIRNISHDKNQTKCCSKICISLIKSYSCDHVILEIKITIK